MWTSPAQERKHKYTETGQQRAGKINGNHPSATSWMVAFFRIKLADFRFDYKYENEYENDFSNLELACVAGAGII